MSTFSDLALEWRNPEYTGENRCIPCTLLNILIAVAISVVIAGSLSIVFAWPVDLAVGAGMVVLAASLSAIGLRGYLVPYTPTITKRYFPERVLLWFDKSTSNGGSPSEVVDDLDIEGELWSIGVIEPCEDIADLCLTTTFQREWQHRIAELRDMERGGRVEQIRTLLDLETDHDVREVGDASAVVLVDDAQVGQWESEAALIADLAADAIFREWTTEWTDRSVAERSQLLNSTRMFLEQCPACNATVALGQETVESCCRSWDVVTVACEACDTRLFEVNVTPEMEEQLAA